MECDMTRYPRPVISLLFLAFSMAACLAQQPATEGDEVADALTPPTPDELFKAPAKPLDPRIKPDKITQTNPPPLPEKIILPLSPQHRIAEDPSKVPINPELWHSAHAAIERGLAYLRTHQAADGTWMKPAAAAPTDQPQQPSPVWLAVTSLAVKAFAQSGPDAPAQPQVTKAISAILGARQPDGSFDNSNLSNYITSSVLMALASVEDEDHHDQIADAVQWLQATQWDQTEGLSARQDWFGGAGYGSHGRPDLSNTQMMLDALYDAGLSPDEPTFQKALTFASRTQNLKATNSAEWAGNDGGFIYTPANGGESF